MLAAMVAVVTAADVHADAAEWERTTAESRPQMPSAKTREKWRAERKSAGSHVRLRGTAPYAAAAEVAERTLGFALPGDAVWRTTYESEDERVEVVVFTDAAGVVNRFALVEQLGTKFPYWWSVERASPDAAIASAKAVAAADGVLARDEVEIIELNEELKIPYARFRYWFLDDRPDFGWIRPCRHLFADADGSGYTVLYGRMKPSIWRKGTDEEILFAGETRTAATATAQEKMDEVAKGVYRKAVRLKSANPGLDYTQGHPESSYFVLISGGGKPDSNTLDFWTDTAMFYSTLTLKYGVGKDNIFVYMSDGNDTRADRKLNNGDYVDSPRDLDGDGEEDVDGPADMASITNCFASLTAKLRPTDRLFVFTTSHGGTIGNAQASNRDATFFLFSHGKSYGEPISDAMFSEMTKDIRCPVAVVMESCFSGGFVDDVTGTPNRVIATACSHFELGTSINGSCESWIDGMAGKTDAWGGTWPAPFIWALRGVRTENRDEGGGYPWNDSDESTDADTNGDGMVSFREAAVYAEENNLMRCTNSVHSWRSADNPSGCYVVAGDPRYQFDGIEHPQYGESTEGLGDNFFVLSQRTTARILIVSPNGPNPEEAYLDPRKWSRATAELTTTEYWYAEVDSGANGWLNVAPSSGVGDCTVTVTATATNTNEERRVGFVKFFSRGGGNQIMAELCVAQGPRRPENDDRADATHISGEAGTAYGTTLRATQNPSDLLAADMGSVGATNTVWWRWVAPETKTVRFTTDFSSIDTVLGVSGGADAYCDDDSAGGTASMVTFKARTNWVYWIVIAGKNGAEGDVQLNWEMFDNLTITFDGNGGAIKESIDADSITNSIAKTFAWGLPLVALPVLVEDPPTGLYRDGGWWTACVGGELVTADTVPTRDATYYAHWIPRNDAKAQATVLSGEEGAASIFKGSATLEADDPMRENGFGCTNTVWYSWTPPADAFVCFDATKSTTTYQLPAGVLGRTFSPVVEVIQVVENDTVNTRSGKGLVKMNVKGGYTCWIGVAGQTHDVPYGTINLEWYPLIRFTFMASNGEIPGTGSAHTNGSIRAGVPLGKELVGIVPTRDDKVFDGWWTAESGGEPVTADTTLTAADDNTYFYAHWRPRPGNDLPAGAYYANPGEHAFDQSGRVEGPNVDASGRSLERAPDPLVEDHGAVSTLWWRFDLRYAGIVSFDTKGSTSTILQGGALDTMIGVYRQLPYDEDVGLQYEELAFNDDGCSPADQGSTLYQPRTSYVEVEVPGGDNGYLYVGVGSLDGAGNVGDIVLDWKYEKLRVTLDTAGGSVETNAVMLPAGVPLGESLREITPWREGYFFAGWRFANGTVVTEEAVITANHTFTATWNPANDDFARAWSLNPVGVPIWEYEVVNSNATVEADEPLAAAWPGVTNTLWWTWTAPADGAARFATTNSVDDYGSEIDTVLGVYTGDALGALVEEARGDDCETDDGVFHYSSMVEFNAVSGTTYRICVGVNDKASRQVLDGTIRLSWTLAHEVTFDVDGGVFADGGTTATFTARHGDSVTPPAASRAGHTFLGWFDEGGAEFGGRAVKDTTYYARWEAGIANDNFENAAMIGGTSGSVSQSNDGATAEMGEPLVRCIGNSMPSDPHSLWWRWTAPANGIVVFDTTGSTYLGYDGDAFEYRNMPYQTVMGIYTGSAVSNLTTVSLSGRNTDNEGNELAPSTNRFEATKGTTYYIGAAGRYDTALNGSQQGVIVLNWGYAYIEPVETLEPLDENESESMVRTAVSMFNDPYLDDVIDGSVAEYNRFVVWVNNVIGDAGEVKASAHAAASYLLGATSLFENEPEVKIGGVEVATVSGGTSLTLTVTVRDGETPKEVSAEKVAALLEATTDLGDWYSPSKKLDPHAEAVTPGCGSTVIIKVSPGDGMVPRVFLRIRK